MTIHEQDRQGYEALTAALETKYKLICKGIRICCHISQDLGSHECNLKEKSFY